MKLELIFSLILSFSAGIYCLERPRGVSIEKAAFYQGSTTFRCLSDGKSIPLEHVNDDYCDCADGSDEPGTSACSNGLFYCENKSIKGSYIMSSRVNDGICDCCDGSDEYDGTISCENLCEKMLAEIRAQQEALREKQEAGYKVKLEYIQTGRRTKDEKLSQLTELSKEKDLLDKEKDILKAAKEEAEAPEKVAKDKHEQAWEAVKAERKKRQETEAASLAFLDLDVNQDGRVDFPEIIRHPEFDIDSDGTVSEEEAREYLEEREEVDLETFTEKIWPNVKEIYKPYGSIQEETKEEKKDEAPAPPEVPEEADPEIPLDDIKEGTTDEKDEKTEEYDDDDDDTEEDDDEEDVEEKNDNKDVIDKKSDLEQVAEEDRMPDYDDETKRLMAIADEARQKYDEADKKVKDIDNEINNIKKYLDLDLGPEEEFSVLKGQCFEYTDREYTYKFCPYEKTSQKPKGGGIETNLGVWGHWHGPEGDKYDSMKYENGQSCWNGPNRSCHVKIHCGSENALTGASEPSRCEYQFEFTTPARCSQPQDTHPHEEL
ncbi:glucosidase 2 subunit beta-like isoform X1 [Physella acuta]|uniref:glucosidase 2 subunit beta-like isoform X1 n=1 Tax=Physella acuta TaxID=109671 RepID=UPI0027DB7733|nr:glucosidase 2 subunit beta-like isoform X1 [Physella acuta]